MATAAAKRNGKVSTNGQARSDEKPTKAKKEAGKSQLLDVKAPRFECISWTIVGTAPYCQNRFGGKSLEQMRAAQLAGDAGKSKKQRDPKDFKRLFQDAHHYSDKGWIGIPAAAFRNALIDACRTIGVVMTRAKMSVFVEPDGFDKNSGDPLVMITKGKPKYSEACVRNADGSPDIRARPMWDPGWEAVVTLKYDPDMITAESVANLLFRAGQQVGVGEGRPYSKKSNGTGFGTFKIKDQKTVNAVRF